MKERDQIKKEGVGTACVMDGTYWKCIHFHWGIWGKETTWGTELAKIWRWKRELYSCCSCVQNWGSSMSNGMSVTFCRNTMLYEVWAFQIQECKPAFTFSVSKCGMLYGEELGNGENYTSGCIMWNPWFSQLCCWFVVGTLYPNSVRLSNKTTRDSVHVMTRQRNNLMQIKFLERSYVGGQSIDENEGIQYWNQNLWLCKSLWQPLCFVTVEYHELCVVLYVHWVTVPALITRKNVSCDCSNAAHWTIHATLHTCYVLYPPRPNTLMLFGEKYKLWTSSFCSFLHPPVTSSLR